MLKVVFVHKRLDGSRESISILLRCDEGRKVDGSGPSANRENGFLVFCKRTLAVIDSCGRRTDVYELQRRTTRYQTLSVQQEERIPKRLSRRQNTNRYRCPSRESRRRVACRTLDSMLLRFGKEDRSREDSSSLLARRGWGRGQRGRGGREHACWWRRSGEKGRWRREMGINREQGKREQTANCLFSDLLRASGRSRQILATARDVESAFAAMVEFSGEQREGENNLGRTISRRGSIQNRMRMSWSIRERRASGVDDAESRLEQ